MYYLFREMRDSIDNKDDKILFDEVITCFNSGAYRAAYILNWLCIAESLKFKFKSMAKRDNELGKFVDKMEKGEIGSIDRRLIDESKSINFINETEYKKISSIQELRNEYAHPNNVSPNSDEVMAAIRTGVDVVLSKKPLLRHGFIVKVLNLMTQEYHYLDDNEDRIKSFTKDIINTINKKTYPFLLKKSLEKLEIILNDNSIDRKYERRLNLFISIFLETIKPDLSNPKWNIDNLIIDYPKSLSTILLNKKLYRLCNNRVKDMVLNLNLEPIIDEKITKPSIYSLEKIYILNEENLLKDNQETKFNEIISTISYPELSNAKIPITEWYHKFIKDFKSLDWNKQNPAATYLLLNIKYIRNLENEIQIELGRNILQSAVGGSFDAQNFLEQFKIEDLEDSEGLIQGMISEIIVNEKNQLRFKGLDYLDKIFNKTCNLNNEIFEIIISNIIEEINNSSIDHGNVLEQEFIEYKSTLENIFSDRSYNKRKKIENLLDLIDSKLDNFKND